MFIYKITNIINDKIYIGFDTGPVDESRRWKVHTRKATNGRNTNKVLYRAMRKHGIENFTYEVIDDSVDNIDDLANMERMYIKKYGCVRPNGMNVCEGGLGGDNFKHMDGDQLRKVKKRMSYIMNKRLEDDEYKQLLTNQIVRAGEIGLKIRNDMSEEEYNQYLKKRSEGTKTWWKNRILTDKDRKRYSEAQKKRFANLSLEEYAILCEVRKISHEKWWRIEDGEGNVYIVKGLKAFSESNNLNYNMLFSSKRYNKRVNGWLVTLA